MTTLTELLTVPRFSDLLILTPEADLTHVVDSIEITETPDVALYMPKNVFLLTTAMHFQNNQDELIPLIDSLVLAEAAGLGIKIGRFLDEIAPEVITYANAKKFPLILVPETKQLGSLLHKLTNYIRHTQTEQITYALDIQKRFSNLLINDANPAKIIGEFGKMVQTPVMLLNPFKEVVAQSSDFSQSRKPAEYFVKQLMETHSFKNDNQFRSAIVSDFDEKKIQVAIYPIKSNSFFPYYLVILKPEQIPYPVSEFAIEQAVLVLSFVQLKNLKVTESQQMIKSDYFLKLIESQQNPVFEQKEWFPFDLNFGIKYSHFYQIVYVNCRNDEKNKFELKYNQEKSQLANYWLAEKLPHHLKDTLVFPIKNSNQLAIVLQTKEEATKVVAVLTSLAEQLEQALPISLAFSFGHSCSRLDALATSYIEAKITFESSVSDSSQNRINYYKPKGMLNLFDNMQPEEVRYFCQSTLKELAYPETSALKELRKTLKTYLNYQCEITRTANELFIHRNTVKYRIDNCQEILGESINNPAASLNLRLALELSTPTD
ncbi:PucR family transcriptional regulator ligand-binding domain-containing protein [uncultured Vagococcus sp.]|uniref:PucR family transcriptional regulator n=1 Tax=uncultured Vagococcus sp. TaxID=189676 RepID=UPI0028D139B3|nr:PucR family transcriptional regulator ligand-binding domain-containing protein [uncultured Vagococcus sp.]